MFQGDSFEVQAGALGFTVVIYTLTAVIGIALLMARRYLDVFGKGELGGVANLKIASACLLVFLWFLYVLLSSLQTYDHISGF